MKALSITQPWASLVDIKAKRLETRSWRTDYRGPLVICAAKGYPKWAQETYLEKPFLDALSPHFSNARELPTGAALCLVNDNAVRILVQKPLRITVCKLALHRVFQCHIRVIREHRAGKCCLARLARPRQCQDWVAFGEFAKRGFGCSGYHSADCKFNCQSAGSTSAAHPTPGPVAPSNPSAASSGRSVLLSTPSATTVMPRACAMLHRPLRNSWLPSLPAMPRM